MLEEFNFAFNPRVPEGAKYPHIPTQGESVGTKLVKVGQLLGLNVQDYLSPMRDEIKAEDEKIENRSRRIGYTEEDFTHAGRFLKKGRQLGNQEVVGFIGSLAHEKGAQSIKIYNESIASPSDQISRLDPFFVITGKEAPTDIAKDWGMCKTVETKSQETSSSSSRQTALVDMIEIDQVDELDLGLESESEAESSTIEFAAKQIDMVDYYDIDQDKEVTIQTDELSARQIDMVDYDTDQDNALTTRKEFKQSDSKQSESIETDKISTEVENYFVYPFVYPSKGFGSFPHIVLIIVDNKAHKIYYYDPQGLTSNDPTRRGVFVDDHTFDMHENLKHLAEALFTNPKGEFLENVANHQIDPVNCGVFICRALEKLYKGEPVIKALSYDPNTEGSITDVRKRVGVAYMNATKALSKRLCSHGTTL